MTARHADVLPPGSVSYGSAFPSAALPDHNPYTLAVLRSWSPGEAATRLSGLSVRDFMRRRNGKRASTVLAAIDHVEELLADTRGRRVARRQFLEELGKALDEDEDEAPRLHLLLLLRDEAADLVSGILGDGARYEVTGLTPAGAIEAVERPAAEMGRPFSDGAAGEVVAALRDRRSVTGGKKETGIAPTLLQVVCTWLWETLPQDLDAITARDVRRYGDTRLALAAWCGQAIATVADDYDLPATRLRSWLLDTFVTEWGTPREVYEGSEVTVGMPNAVLRALEDRHLLSVKLKDGLRWYELPADALVGSLREAMEQRAPHVPAEEYLEAAGRALSLGDLGLARRFAEEALRLSRDADLQLRAKAHSLLGNAASEGGKPDKAAAHYRLAAVFFEAARDTRSVAFQLAAVGRMLLAQQRQAEAVEELQAAVARLPGDPVIQTELGLALWQLGNGSGAIAVLNGVLGIDGRNDAALRARGEILAYMGKARDAMLDLNRVTLHERPSTRAARGLALTSLGDQPTASREIENAIAEAPRNGPVLLYAARASELEGDVKAAERLARQAVDAVDPALPPQQREMALELAARKRGKAASG